MVAYEGSISWSNLIDANDQHVVTTYITAFLQDPYYQRRVAQLARPETREKRDGKLAFTEAKLGLIALCQPNRGRSAADPLTARLKRMRQRVPKDILKEFVALHLDAPLLANELLMMIRKYPEHCEDVEFLSEQLFSKVPVAELVKEQPVASAPSSSGDGKISRSCVANWDDGAALEQQSRRYSAGSSGSDRRAGSASSGHGRADHRRRSSASSHSRRSSASSRSRSRSRSSSRSRSRSASRSRSTSRSRSELQSNDGTDVVRAAAGDLEPEEPGTPRACGRQSTHNASTGSVAAFEAEMAAFVDAQAEQRRRSSASDSDAGTSERVEMEERRLPTLQYTGAASVGGSFLAPLPSFGNNGRVGSVKSSKTLSGERVDQSYSPFITTLSLVRAEGQMQKRRKSETIGLATDDRQGKHRHRRRRSAGT